MYTVLNSFSIYVYFLTLPFIIFILLVLSLLFLFSIYILVSIAQKGSESFFIIKLITILKTKPIKALLCSIIFSALLYIEIFNGIETFQSANKFFEFKREIGIGHIIPYQLHSSKYYESGNVASYADFPLHGYDLYLYKGVLYYYPFTTKDYSLNDNEPPSAYWLKWGQRSSYRPD